ncbi:MAG: Stage 0 sporulation A-like protein [Lachnoclostridium sp.]|jgi:two-component system, response regulator YesN
MMKVLIADDEAMIREGLKCIINWEELGFTVCKEASNGEETLKDILTLNPDLVLLDIRMPRLSGTELVRLAREQEYKGHFIILSGYSDFKYAQTAIRWGVDFYLTKPIDEEELFQAVKTVKEALEKEKLQASTMNHYREKAKYTILMDILLNTCDYSKINPEEINLLAPVYRVVIYENYNQETLGLTYNFADLLKVTNQGNNSFDYVKVQQKNVILLKGNFALDRFNNVLRHYENKPQKGSPLDSLFVTYGRLVYKLEDIHYSYEDALSLLSRRFFCKQDQHVIGFEQLPDYENCVYEINPNETKFYSDQFCNYIQSFNRQMIHNTLEELVCHLYNTKANLTDIKLFLTDIYLQVKQKIQQLYSTAHIPFPSNSSVINLIESKYYLYEIIQFFSQQFELFMNAITTSSSDSILEDIIHYIHHNYRDNIKLESIAPLFGYNSSYLGKIFHNKTGEYFNTYVDQVRIKHSLELLAKKNQKIYEIAELVGYKNVDYFHKKFKKHMGISPAEYRRKIHMAESNKETPSTD